MRVVVHISLVAAATFRGKRHRHRHSGSGIWGAIVSGVCVGHYLQYALRIISLDIVVNVVSA